MLPPQRCQYYRNFRAGVGGFDSDGPFC